jgi:hypothetical protein
MNDEIVSGKLDGFIKVNGTGVENGNATITVECKMFVNYDNEGFDDFNLINFERTYQGFVDESGVLKYNGEDGILIVCDAVKTDGKTDRKFDLKSKFRIYCSGEVTAIEKESLSFTVSGINNEFNVSSRNGYIPDASQWGEKIRIQNNLKIDSVIDGDATYQNSHVCGIYSN